MLDKAKPALGSLGLSSPFISPLDLCYVTWYLHSFRPQRMRQVEQIGFGNGYLMTLFPWNAGLGVGWGGTRGC